MKLKTITFSYLDSLGRTIASILLFLNILRGGRKLLKKT